MFRTRDKISSQLNLAWNALKSGDFPAAREHAEHVLRSKRLGRDNAVNAHLILLKMKTQAGEFDGLLDELEELFRANPRVRSHTRAALANEIIRVSHRSRNLGIGAVRGEEFITGISRNWPDTEVVEMLCQVASCHFLRGDLDRAEKLVLRALDLAQTSKSPQALAQSSWQLSSLAIGRGNMPMSISHNQQARKWAEIAEMSRVLPILNSNAAAILLELPDQNLQEIHDLAEAAYLELIAQHDPGSAAYACVNLAEVELRRKNFEEALKYVEMGLHELPLEVPGPRADLLIQKAKIMARIGTYEDAELLANNAATLLKEMESSRFLATSWAHLARVFVEAGLPERGLFAYEQALQIAGVIREETEESLDTDLQTSLTVRHGE